MRIIVLPRGPSKLDFGILQSSKLTVAVEEARMPSLSSFLPRTTRGAWWGWVGGRDRGR